MTLSQSLRLFVLLLLSSLVSVLAQGIRQHIFPPYDPFPPPDGMHSPIPGWNVFPWIWDSYEYGISDSVFYNEKPSVFIRSKYARPDSLFILQQTFMATQYRKKRMAYSGMLKMEAIDISAGLTMWIDNSAHQPLSYDDMFGRNVTETKDWGRYKVVLDVPEDAWYIRIGIAVRGIGEVWVSSMTFEETKDETTGRNVYEDEPTNLDFSKK
jgi:hypothetical protein